MLARRERDSAICCVSNCYVNVRNLTITGAEVLISVRPLAPLFFANCLLGNVKEGDLTHSCEAPVTCRLSRVEIMSD